MCSKAICPSWQAEGIASYPCFDATIPWKWTAHEQGIENVGIKRRQRLSQSQTTKEMAQPILWSKRLANLRSRNATVCFTWARNIVFRHKMNLCLCWCWAHGVISMCLAVLYMCIIWVHIGLVCVYLRCYRTHGELRMVSNQHITYTKKPEHTLAPIYWL